MYIYKYSYKSDPISEVIGSVVADSYDSAIIKIAEIKRLSISDILNLFNVKQG